MDQRTLLALSLTAIVIVVTPLLFPAPRQPRAPVSDSVAAPRREAPAAPAAPTAAPGVSARQSTSPPGARQRARSETTTVRTARAIYQIVSPGGVPAAVTLPDYRSLRQGAAGGTPVDLIEPGDRLFHLSYSNGSDTVALDTVSFHAGPQRQEGSTLVQTLTSTSLARPITLTYRFPADSFIVHVEGVFPANGGRLAVSLPARLRSEEADARDNASHLSLAYRVGIAEVKSIPFRSLDTLVRTDTGTIRWLAERNKYFVVAIVPTGRDSAFHTLRMRGEAHVGGEATVAHTSAILLLTGQGFALRVFAGPQSWEHLRVTAPELENVNPYGGWLHGLVQPFATIVMRLLLWMRDTVDVGYGWVLVIFGVAVRLLMWPLNQNAMRSSMKLQRIQPQLTEIQAKYRNDPEKQREAMLRLYQEHGMSPFTPVLGCLPMMLPMPILFALYFVFQNTIELRGVSFMWLPDLSLKDPYFITPLFMGASMFVLSWIGMRGMPPSPQSKMMLYVMPVMFTVLFWNFASGLNLYYAVQNVAALPQQWLLARERTTQPDGAKKLGGKGAPGG